jgi:ribosomal protein L24E
MKIHAGPLAKCWSCAKQVCPGCGDNFTMSTATDEQFCSEMCEKGKYPRRRNGGSN